MACKTYRFESPDEVRYRTVGKDVRASLERAAAINGFDSVTVAGRRYSLQSTQDIERAVTAIERGR